jgi:hypothetical protein
MVFLFMGSYSLKADGVLDGDQDFMKDLDNIKNPFEDGFPKPVIIDKPVIHQEQPVIIPKKVVPKPIAVVPQVVSLPDLHLQGVIVGDGIYQAIINDKIVPLQGTIEGARVDSVNKQVVGLIFKGKKFFLKVE